jgi:hypothetical protein
MQAIICSHHPEVINEFATANALWISRPRNGSSQLRRFSSMDETGLQPAEAVARGWIDEQ